MKQVIEDWIVFWCFSKLGFINPYIVSGFYSIFNPFLHFPQNGLALTSQGVLRLETCSNYRIPLCAEMEPGLPCIENNLDDHVTDVSVRTFRADHDKWYRKDRALKVHYSLFVPRKSYFGTVAFLHIISLGQKSCRSGFERRYTSLGRSNERLTLVPESTVQIGLEVWPNIFSSDKLLISMYPQGWGRIFDVMACAEHA